MVILILLLLLSILTIIYLYFYTKKVLELIYSSKDNQREEIAYENLLKFKTIWGTIYVVPLFISIFMSRYITLDAWLIIYYAVWILGLIYVVLNLKMLNHILDIIFVKSSLVKIEKDFLFGAIKRRGANFIFFHRIMRDTIKL